MLMECESVSRTIWNQEHHCNKGHILPTMHSKIVEKKIYEKLDEPTFFIESMLDLYEEFKHRAKKLLVTASNENYAELAISHKAELEPRFILPFISEELMDEVVYKESFYEICEEYGLDYPDTLIFKKEWIRKWSSHSISRLWLNLQIA